MTTNQVLPGIALDLAGPVNFRDIGGYRTSDGCMVRHRKLYRSDGLWSLSETDISHLIGEIGLRTVVDLRAPTEIERYGPCPLERAGLLRHHVSFIDESLRPDLPSDGNWTLDQLYLFLLRQAGSRVTRVLTMLSSSDVYPAVFHCTAGKDRTGVVTALVLGLLSVSDGDIADDYARTASVMPAFTQRARSFLEQLGQEAPQFSDHVMSADRDTMLRLLAAVRSEHGSLENWARSNGMTTGALLALRANLLTRP